MSRKWLEITTYIGCPNMCSYCPQELLMKSYKGKKVMSISNFKKILKNVPSDVEIHFSGFSELFFHKDALEFIKEAKKSHEVVVYTTTNGMTQEVADELANIHFKEFNVHVNQRRSNVKLNFQHYTTAIDDSNKISRGGNLWEVKERAGKCARSLTFEQNVVLPNGDVYLCCMDYGLKHKLGNIYKTNFNDLKREKFYELCKTCESCINYEV